MEDKRDYDIKQISISGKKPSNYNLISKSLFSLFAYQRNFQLNLSLPIQRLEFRHLMT